MELAAFSISTGYKPFRATITIKKPFDACAISGGLASEWLSVFFDALRIA
jgi:hypothetical protein